MIEGHWIPRLIDGFVHGAAVGASIAGFLIVVIVGLIIAALLIRWFVS